MRSQLCVFNIGRLLTTVITFLVGGVSVAAGEPKERLTLVGHSDEVFSVAFSHDGKTIASASGDKTIKLWDGATGKIKATLEGHTGRIWTVAFSPDSKALVSYADDRDIRAWDLTTGKSTGAMGPFARAHSIVFSPDGKKVFFGGNGQVNEWDLVKNETKKLLPPSKGGNSFVGMTKDGKLLSVIHFYLGEDATVWDVANGTFVILEKCRRGAFYTPFSPDGKLVATGFLRDEVELWDCAAGKLKTTVKLPSQSTFLAFSPDGETIAIAFRGKDGSLKEGNIVLLETATGKEIITFKRHNQAPATVMALAFSPDGKTLASASLDRTVKVFDVPVARNKKK